MLCGWPATTAKRGAHRFECHRRTHRDNFRTSVAVTGNGDAVVVWSGKSPQGVWTLFSRTMREGSMTPVASVASGGENVYHQTVADSAGTVHVALAGVSESRLANPPLALERLVLVGGGNRFRRRCRQLGSGDGGRLERQRLGWMGRLWIRRLQCLREAPRRRRCLEPSPADHSLSRIRRKRVTCVRRCRQTLDRMGPR